MKSIARAISSCTAVGFASLLLATAAVLDAAPSDEAIIRRYFDEWANHADVRAADELIATNLVMHHALVTSEGLAAYKRSMAGFHASFPDVHFAIEDLISDEGKVLVRWLMTGTHRAEYMGQPATGKSVRVTGMSLFRMDGGRIQEIWASMDRLGFMQQLGLVTLPAASPAANQYFELRLYTVTSNKMDGVLERFRDTVEPVRKKHGIQTVGYWSAPGTTNGGTFAYLMAAASKEELQRNEKELGADPQFKEGYAASNKKHGKTVEKIATLPLAADATAKFDFAASAKSRAFDLRVYSVLPGKLDAFRNRWRDFAVPIFERHGLHSVGWWAADKMDADGNYQVVCLLTGESLAAIQKSIAAFHADPEWRRVEVETERDGRLLGGITAFQMTPADFSQLK